VAKVASSKIHPPVVALAPKQHSQSVVSPQYGHAHLQSSMG